VKGRQRARFHYSSDPNVSSEDSAENNNIGTINNLSGWQLQARAEAALSNIQELWDESHNGNSFLESSGDFPSNRADVHSAHSQNNKIGK
jgi:hypothetical protein